MSQASETLAFSAEMSDPSTSSELISGTRRKRRFSFSVEVVFLEYPLSASDSLSVESLSEEEDLPEGLFEELLLLEEGLPEELLSEADLLF